MQATTGTLRRVPGRNAAQAILIIAVALAGVAFGRWIIPAAEGDSSPAAHLAEVAAPDNSRFIIESKLARMDREDAVVSIVAGAVQIPGHESLSGSISLKLLQMDQLDGSAVVLGAAEAPLADSPPAGQALDSKLAQMDGLDAGLAPAASTLGLENEGPSANSLIEGKLAQMDALDASR